MKVYLTFADVNPSTNPSPGVTPAVIWRNPRVVTRAAAPAGAGRGRGAAGPILSTQSLRAMLPADVAGTLGFGKSPDGTVMGPEDFAATRTVSFSIDLPQVNAPAMSSIFSPTPSSAATGMPSSA